MKTAAGGASSTIALKADRRHSSAVRSRVTGRLCLGCVLTFQFELPDRPVDDNVRRAARAEFDRAIAEVSETGFEMHGTIRNVRRRLKRVRSIIRLIRPVFGEHRAEARALRSIGAEVGKLRDAMALVEAVDLLATERNDERSQALGRVRRALAASAATHESDVERESFLADLRVRLREARVRSELWELASNGDKAILPGLLATYSEARRGLANARRTMRDTAFHEWRKAVKDHASHLSLLRGLAPAFADGRRARTKKLATALGDLQNISLLRAALKTGVPGLAAGDRETVEPLIAAALESLRTRTLKLGRPLFVQRPAEIRKRWQAYLGDWRDVRHFP